MSNIIKVLDTEYTVNTGDYECNPKFEYADADGLCEFHTKQIWIRTGYENNKTCADNIIEYKKKVLRHELIHALFWEVGQADYANNEHLVDLIACLYPKLESIMKQVDNIDLGINNV